MAFVWSAALKDLRRMGSDPLSFLLWLGIPLLIGGMIILATGGRKGVSPRAELLVVDEDDSLLSRLLLGALGQSGADSVVQAEAVEREEGLERIHAGDGSALLIIPEGFGAAMLREEPTRLELLKNPAQTILPGIVEEMLSVLVDGSFYVHRVFGEELRQIADMVDGEADAGPMDADVATLSVSINRAMSRLEKYLFPPVIEYETVAIVKEGSEAEESPGLGLLFLPGILFMALLFMAQGMSEDLWKERRLGTLRRALGSPNGPAAFLLGKLAASSVAIGSTSLVYLAAGQLYLGIDLALLPLAVLWSLVTGLVFLTAMFLLQLLARSERAGNLISLVVIFPLMMVGGSFFPFAAMPEAMAAIGRLTPNGWALQHLVDILAGRADSVGLWVGFPAMVGLGVLFLLLSASRTRRVLARS